MSRRFTTYDAALEFLYNRINYERVQSTAYSAGDFKLNRMRSLLERIGHPEEQIPAVHIAGTKGKGSTAAMVAAMLSANGLRVGLFTSPHIARFEERMTVAGRQPTETEIVELVNALVDAIADLDQELGGMSPTYFEITTAMAWLFFRQERAEIVVLEVGLGGRLDATNVCRPEVCVITSISRDHTHLLGSEVQQIAREKAGIIKTGVPVISGVLQSPAKEAIVEVADQRQAPLRQLADDFHYECFSPEAEQVEINWWDGNARWTRLPVPLLGAHQSHNTALAVAALHELQQRGWKITEERMRAGLSNVVWPARIEVLRQDPVVVLDAAHNWESVKALLSTLEHYFAGRHKILIFAATRDKDVWGMLRLLLPACETVILTCYQSNPRTVPLDVLWQQARSVCDRPVHLANSPREAWELASRLARPEDLIVIAGSFFIAAELRDVVLGQPAPV